jgi:hypothetical protein
VVVAGSITPPQSLTKPTATPRPAAHPRLLTPEPSS